MPELAPKTAYDQVPYESRAFPETHPDHLATQAILCGATPPSVGGCRVLELGCASGGNLIPLALALPGATFVGIDLSARQIDLGLKRVEQFGLKNITLRQLDIADVDETLGTFDYILCHGVYSWVAPAIQEAIFRTCARNLAPDGVAYVSFNVFPGWHPRGLVRELMMFHVEGVADPDQRAAGARAVLRTILDAIPNTDSSYARQLAELAAPIASQDDDYLHHEYLEEENHPLYFTDFVAEAADHGLRWMTEARFRTRADQQPEPIQRTLHSLAPDPSDMVRREQYHDFLRNRTFRRALLVHADRPVSQSIDSGRIASLLVRGMGGPVSPTPSITTNAVEEFRSADGREVLRTSNPLVKATLMVLCSRWPRALSVSDLIASLRDLPTESLDAPPLATSVPDLLLECYRAGLVEFTTHEPVFATTPGANPQAGPLVLAQAEAGKQVTNLFHRMVELTDFERLVVRQLDGQRDRAEILDILVACSLDGRFPLHQNGQPILDPMVARPILSRSLDLCLKRLALSALLIG
jgi:methyltransferase-like protein/ubiquinone/menaquinone biosynthesis C-methylase UbiE